MKVSDYTQCLGVSYKTAWRRWRGGKLDACQVATGANIVRDPAPRASQPLIVARVAVYVRVSTTENRTKLEGQADRLVA
jgi:predicted site-specific integrase-resolvase